MLFDSSKRKNDDKAKGRPRSRMFAIAILVVLFVSGAVLYVLLRPEPVAYPHFPSSLLWFTSDDVRYTVNLQTGERAKTNRSTHVVHSTAWSPDEKWIAFWEPTSDKNTWELMVSQFQNMRTQRSFGKFVGVSTLNWSADSDHLTFSATFDVGRPDLCECDKEIFIISRETGELKRLTVNANFESDPMFSPDGTQIVYTSALDNYNRLYVMDVATETWRVLTPDLHGYNPVWSPDGQWIAFMTTSFDTNGDIWIIRPDGTDAQPVTTGPGHDSNPKWESDRKMPYTT